MHQISLKVSLAHFALAFALLAGCDRAPHQASGIHSNGTSSLAPALQTGAPDAARCLEPGGWHCGCEKVAPPPPPPGLPWEAPSKAGIEEARRMLARWQADEAARDPWIRSLRIDGATLADPIAWNSEHANEKCQSVRDETWSRFCAWAPGIDPSAPHEKRIVAIVVAKGQSNVHVTRREDARPEECKPLFLPPGGT